MNSEMKEMVYKKERSNPEILYSGVYGYHKFAIISLGTHPCAYIERKMPGKLDYNNSCFDTIDVHGGLSFCDRAYWDANDKSIYIGWDYAHCCDFYGGFDELLNYKKKKWTTKEIFEEICSAIDNLSDIEENYWKYKTKTYQEIKDKMWDIIKNENLMVSNQNIDYIIQKIFKEN